MAAREMRGERAAGVVSQAAEVHDLSDFGVRGGIAEVLRRRTITLPPVRLRTDRVHQVVGRVDVVKARRERRTVEHVADDDLDVISPGLRVELLRGAGQAADTVARRDQLANQSPADVAGGA